MANAGPLSAYLSGPRGTPANPSVLCKPDSCPLDSKPISPLIRSPERSFSLHTIWLGVRAGLEFIRPNKNFRRGEASLG